MKSDIYCEEKIHTILWSNNLTNSRSTDLKFQQNSNFCLMFRRHFFPSEWNFYTWKAKKKKKKINMRQKLGNLKIFKKCFR